MSDTTNATAPPPTETTHPEASDETKALNAAIDAEEGANAEGGEQKGDAAPPKKEKTHEEREIARLRRRVDTLTRRLYEGRTTRAESTNDDPGATNPSSQTEAETLQLTRAELQKLVDAEARKRAPEIRQQEAEAERKRAVATQLAKTWGRERFDALASDLDDAFDGLADDNGRPKPATDAIFEADDPASLIEYLADPEHADEAEALGRMSAVQAGRAIAKIEARLTVEKAKAKPQPSKAPAPIEEVKGQGGLSTRRLAELSDADFDRKRREQIAKRR